MSGCGDHDGGIGLDCAADRAVIGFGSVGRAGRRNIHRIFGAVYVVMRNDAIPDRGGDFGAVVHRVGVFFGIRDLLNRLHEVLPDGHIAVGDRKVDGRAHLRPGRIQMETAEIHVGIVQRVGDAALTVGRCRVEFAVGSVRHQEVGCGCVNDHRAVNIDPYLEFVGRVATVSDLVFVRYRLAVADADPMPAPLDIVRILTAYIREIFILRPDSADVVVIRESRERVVGLRMIATAVLETAGILAIGHLNVVGGRPVDAVPGIGAV